MVLRSRAEVCAVPADAALLMLPQNLMSLEWRPKKVEASGNLQFEATDASGALPAADASVEDDRLESDFRLMSAFPGDVLMMLPTDMALKTDPVFAQHAAAYSPHMPCVTPCDDAARAHRDVMEPCGTLHVLTCRCSFRYAADQQLFFKDFRCLLHLLLRVH